MHHRSIEAELRREEDSGNDVFMGAAQLRLNSDLDDQSGHQELLAYDRLRLQGIQSRRHVLKTEEPLHIGGFTLLVMELCDVDLYEVIREQGAQHEAGLWHVFRQVVDCLLDCH